MDGHFGSPLNGEHIGRVRAIAPAQGNDIVDQQSELPESGFGERERRQRLLQCLGSAAEDTDGISIQFYRRAADALEHGCDIELRRVAGTALDSRSLTEYAPPSIPPERHAGLFGHCAAHQSGVR